MSRQRRPKWLRTSLVAAALAFTAGMPAAHAQGPAASRPGPAPNPVERLAAAGSWQVDRVGDGLWRVTWVSTRDLPLTADRPVISLSGGGRVGATELRGDHRSVQAIVHAPTRPTTDRLAIRLSGVRLDAPAASRRSTAPAKRVADIARTPVTNDPGRPGPFAVVSSDYTLPGVRYPGFEQPIEMVGHVVEPAPGAATGSRPLVLFLHGRHSVCYRPGHPDQMPEEWPCKAPDVEIPSHLGYLYAQKLLASQGYTTVSIRVNGVNAQDWDAEDGGAAARALIVRRHLDHWVGLAAAHKVDLSTVVLVGHSRGGEGVNRASIEIPLSAPYRIVGQVLVGPTDFAMQTAPYVPTVTLLPYCDGDVSDLQGQKFTDVSRDLVAGDTSLKSSVLVMGANHNFFNTEWTPGQAVAPAWDDWFGEAGSCSTSDPTRLSATEQQTAGKAWMAAAVHRFLAPSQELQGLFDGQPLSMQSAGRAIAFTHALGADRDLRRPGIDAQLGASPTADAQVCEGYAGDGPHRVCGREASPMDAPHWTEQGLPTRGALEVAWSAPDQSARLDLDRPLDLSGRRLQLRVIADTSRPQAMISLRLTNSSGTTVDVTPDGGGILAAFPRLPGWDGGEAGKLVAQTVSATVPAGFDAAKVTAVDVVSGSERGRVWVLDAASVGSGVPAVPATRLAQLNLGSLEVDEGDGPGTVTYRLPVTIVGTLTRPATVRVFSLDDQGSDTYSLRIPAGATSASVAFDGVADTTDDLDRLEVVALMPETGAITDNWIGTLLVKDDDPSPKASLHRVRTVTAEGSSVRWRLSLAAPVDYDLEPGLEFVHRGVSASRYLREGDVPRSWLADRTAQGYHSTWPLYRPTWLFSTFIPAGESSTTISMPTRADGVREPREGATLQAELLGQTPRSTAYVGASR